MKIEEAVMASRDNRPGVAAGKNVVVSGGASVFQLVSSAFDEKAGWTRTVQAMDVGVGVVLETLFSQSDRFGKQSISTSTVYIPGVMVEDAGRGAVRIAPIPVDQQPGGGRP